MKTSFKENKQDRSMGGLNEWELAGVPTEGFNLLSACTMS
jgi:hypothetical protein